MGVRNQNSTSYVHPDEPNLLNLHKAMTYDEAGLPHLRVSLGTDTITINGDVNLVDKVKLWDGTDTLVFDMPNNDGETAPVSLPTENHNMVFNGSTWDRMRGTINDGVLVKLSNGSIAVTGTFWQATQPVSIASMPTTPVTGTFWQATQPVSGTVALDANTLSALENIGVTGTVTVQDGGGSITVDGSVSATVSGSVSVSNFPATQAVTGTFWQATQPVSIASMPTTPVTGTFWQATQPVSGSVSATVSGTVELGTTTLSALENTTVTISGTPTVNIGTIPEVEIKNDSGNPIPISKNTTVNSSANPIYVNANLVGSGEFSGIASSIDSKGRLKVQTQETIFFNTFQYGKETDVWDEATTNGGTATFDAAYSQIRMAVTSAVGSKVIRQTRNVQRYTPGRSQHISFAVRMETPVTGIRRRMGMYNQEGDGFFFEDCGTVDGAGQPQYACVVVNSGTNTTERIYRADWNGDKLDGTGPSGITANPAAQQLVSIEYEWYGSGQIVFMFVIDGLPRVIHTVNNGNRLFGPWAKTPFLPIRLEIENLTGVAGTHYLWQGSNSLLTEGRVEKLGIAESILTPLTGINMSSANTFYPIISIRLKSTALQGIVLPAFFQAGTVDNTDIYYKLLRNATVNGTWVDHPDPNAFTQYNYTSTGAITDGSELTSGLLTASGAAGAIPLDQATVYQIGRGSLGTVSDTITLAIAAKNANKNAVANMTWIEQR